MFGLQLLTSPSPPSAFQLLPSVLDSLKFLGIQLQIHLHSYIVKLHPGSQRSEKIVSGHDSYGKRHNLKVQSIARAFGRWLGSAAFLYIKNVFHN